MEKSLHLRRPLSSFPCPPFLSHLLSSPWSCLLCTLSYFFFHSLTNAFVRLTGFPGKYFVSCTDPTRCVLLKKFIRWDRWTHRLCSSGLRISLSWSQDPNSGTGTPIGWLGIHILLWWRIVRCHMLSQKWEFGTGLPPQMSPMSTSAIFSEFSRLRA